VKIFSYLGPPGTFSAKAAKIFAHRIKLPDAQFRPYPSIPEAILAVLRKEVDFGVVPVENSLEGSVNVTLDMLAQNSEVVIFGEVVLTVKHHLLGKPGCEKLGVLVTHPQAFAQCYQYISKNIGSQVEVRFASSTAEAARVVSTAPPGWVAIGGEEAAKEYGLEVLVSDIQDNPLNKTRFLVLSREAAPPSGNDKTSLVFALPEDRPGGLYHVLGVFAEAAVNLTKIESRPAKKELGDYIFFLDCLGHAALPPLREVLEKLKQKTAMLKVLGSYPCAPGVDC